MARKNTGTGEEAARLDLSPANHLTFTEQPTHLPSHQSNHQSDHLERKIPCSASEPHLHVHGLEELPHEAATTDPMALPTNTLPRPRTNRKSKFQEEDVDTIVPRTILEARTSSFSSVGTSGSLRSRTNSDSSVFSDDESFTTTSPRHTRENTRLAAFSKHFLPTRLAVLACTLLLSISLIYDTPLLARGGPSILGARAGVINTKTMQKRTLVDGKLLLPRADSETDVCNRWSGQSAIVNGTIYYYGGHVTTEQGQESNTWTNGFITIDVLKSWQIDSPAVKGLSKPDGPPAVANGYLWNSYDTLYLYGGIFSDSPKATPTDQSLWSYDIKSGTWTEHDKLKTSPGNNSEAENQSVERAGEGAGVSVPELGRGFYFAGHLDAYTTPGWSNQIPRLYLKSLIEYTFPGYSNDGVESLSDGEVAGEDGVFRNITEGGIQDSKAFANRADSALVYVPGYGAQGILVSMGGGTNVSFVSQGPKHFHCKSDNSI